MQCTVPTAATAPLRVLQVERQRRLERIKQKQAQLQELILQVGTGGVASVLERVQV